MNRTLWGVMAVGALAAGAVTWWVWHRPAATAGPLELYGNVDIREVELAFRQGGRIATLAVDEGASVARGQVLATLEAQPLQDQWLMARANLAQAEAELAKLRQGNRRQEIAQAEAAQAQAAAAAQEAERHFARQQALLAEGASSERAVDAARSARDQTAAALASARHALSLRREGARPEDLAAAQARVASAQAAVALAHTAMTDAQLLAPSDGVVSTRLREAGSIVGAGVTVYTLSLQDPVYVRAYVSQPQLTQVKPGAPVQVVVDGRTAPLPGTVGFISPRAEFTPRAVQTPELRTDLVYRVRIAVPGGADALRQGMPVTVRLGDHAGS